MEVENLRFELPEKAPMVIIETRLNCEGPFKFLVDTGSSVTVITKETVEALGFQEKLSDLKKGSIGCCSSTLVNIGAIQVDDVEAKAVPVVLGNLSTISNEIGTHIDGIIGATLMKNYKVTIDFPKQEIFFEQLSQGKESSGRVPFIFVEVVVNRRGPFNFLVDTGASITTITKHTSEALGLYEKARGRRSALSGSFAGVAMTLAKAECIRVGDAKAKDVDVGLHDLTPLSNMMGTPVDGILGYNFMKDYRVVINYPQQEVSFVRACGNDSEVRDT